MKTYAEITARRDDVKMLSAHARYENVGQELLNLLEESLILSDIAGHDEADMMSEDGIVDYFFNEYPEEHPYYEVAETVRKWVLS